MMMMMMMMMIHNLIIKMSRAVDWQILAFKKTGSGEYFK
jgi:hypothetical protein